MPDHPTESIRIHLSDIEEAMTQTGLKAGPAVRKLLGEALERRRVPVTLEDRARAAHAAIERLVEGAK